MEILCSSILLCLIKTLHIKWIPIRATRTSCYLQFNQWCSKRWHYVWAWSTSAQNTLQLTWTEHMWMEISESWSPRRSPSCILSFSCISFCGVSNRINHKQYFPCGRNCFQVLLNGAAEKHEKPWCVRKHWFMTLNISHLSFTSNVSEWSQSNQWNNQRALTPHLHSLGFQKNFPIDSDRVQ